MSRVPNGHTIAISFLVFTAVLGPYFAESRSLNIFVVVYIQRVDLGRVVTDKAGQW